jgi:hypothetical protein
MIVSLDFFGFEDGSIFDTQVAHTEYNSLEVYGGLIDHLYVDEDLNVFSDTDKNQLFYYSTVILGSFSGSLEAGSISNYGIEIDRIRFQKRKSDELYWTDVAELEYDSPNKTLYEALDKYIQNDFEYEYSLVPVTDEILGLRVKSKPIIASFDGYFISDKDNNFQLLFNAEMGSIDHVSPSTVFEPLNSEYPIVSYGNLDYRQSSISAVVLSPSSYDTGIINIRAEKMGREKMMKFIKSRKPKIFRGQNSEIMLMTIVDNPKEDPNNKVAGVASVSFSFIEIGDLSSESLRKNGLIEGLSEV